MSEQKTHNDIQTFEYTVPGPEGAKTVYSVKVVCPDDGGLHSSVQTADYEEASKFYEAAKEANPDATVNGAPAPADSPLTDSHPSFDKTVGPGKQAEDWHAVPGDTDAMKQADHNMRDMSGFNDRNKTFTANTTKKAVDCSGLPPAQRKICEAKLKDKIKRGVSGAFGGRRMQAMVNRIDCESEDVRTGPDNNAYIVIGNDRAHTKASGYGGKAHTQCDAIDIVCGMGGFAPQQVDAAGSKAYTNPNFYLDSARIYLSQKTDIDVNFGLGTEAGMQRRSEAKSAIALKADNVRLIARESLCLVTNPDSFNSQGGQIQQWSGIHLMANNDEEGLQPIPVGNNLAQALFELSKHLESLGKIFHGYLKYQMKFNQAVSKHTHFSPFFGKPTLKSQQCKAAGMLVDIEHISKTELGVLTQLTNLAGYRNNYLTMKGKNYINSRFNKTN
jgi:hypothetical protein